MSSSIQGQVLELRVTGCRKLRDTEFFSRQDPYVVVEYANTKLRTRTCTDGGRNPTFDDKFHIPLIEGLRELNIIVWNSNTLSNDDFIGSCRVQLHKALTSGYDDSSWPLQTRHMKSAGEVRLIMHFDVSAMKNKMAGKSAAASSAHSVPPVPAPLPYAASSLSYPAPTAYPAAPPHQAYPTPGHAPYPTPSAYASPPPQQPCPHHAYPPTSQPPQPYGQPYPPQPYAQPYPPQPYGQPYPPQPYGQPYPPPSAAQSPYPPAPYPGVYPPPPPY
ncbi:U1 small nuclear ribonucleoprotein C [Brachypodium distachyon]|uniref:C2 domain-containing protein n=1 Tax=Brachypodium distachyon TaxID=15368 RepID=I1GVC9_BRADI|nr:U1 small nuclear ribonucleoprotein C [Brachypodium distachyon]KQK16742.1 hypothetical protein BRADI_1g30310v3 [Brachypodium distachyon]|eukprot:XP_003563289.1 U1 small nuclear ribonucleoprotein C [Brachypodium distachyon]